MHPIIPKMGNSDEFGFVCVPTCVCTVFHRTLRSSQVAAMSILTSLEKQRQMIQNKEVLEPTSSTKSQASGKRPSVLHHYEIIMFFSSLRTRHFYKNSQMVLSNLH